MEEDLLAVASAEKVRAFLSLELLATMHARLCLARVSLPIVAVELDMGETPSPPPVQLLLWDYSAASVTGNPRGEIRQAIGAKRALRAVQFHPRNSRMLLTAEARRASRCWA